MNGYIAKGPTGSWLTPKVSRDGIPVIVTLKNCSYVMVFEGSYRNKEYKIFKDDALKEYHKFEIVLAVQKMDLIGQILLKYLIKKLKILNIVLHIFALLKMLN